MVPGTKEWPGTIDAAEAPNPASPVEVPRMDPVDWLSGLTVTPFQEKVIVALVAAGATWLATRVNSGSQQKRERQAREAEHRRVFERDALVAVQDALDYLYHVVEETVLKRFPPNRNDVQHVEVPPEPLEYRKAEGTVSSLQERVLDDDIRAMVERVIELAGEVMNADSRVTVHDRGELLRKLSLQLHEQLGKRLRSLYKQE
jgi:hypothetical protein